MVHIRWAGLPIVNRRIRGRAACYRRRCRVAAIGVIVIGAVIGIVIRSLVPLVVTRQDIGGSLAAIRIRGVVIKRVRCSPQCDVVVDTTGRELISGKAASAGIEPVDEPGSFVPRNTRRGLGRATVVLGDLQ